MLGVFENLSALADVTTDANRHIIRAHIAEMLAKIPLNDRLRIKFEESYIEAELPQTACRVRIVFNEPNLRPIGTVPVLGNGPFPPPHPLDQGR
jgi:hypothetical protein